MKALIAPSFTLILMAPSLLPFNGAGGFGAYVVDDPVDPFNLIDDPRRDPPEDVIGKLCPVGGHRVTARNDAERHDVRIRAAVAHLADFPRFDWQISAS